MKTKTQHTHWKCVKWANKHNCRASREEMAANATNGGGMSPTQAQAGGHGMMEDPDVWRST